MSELHIPRIAILASGNGTTAEAYARAVYTEAVSAEIGLVVASKADAKILPKVEQWNQEYGFDVKTAVINGETHQAGKNGRGQTLAESEAICALLAENEIGFVALLGYMRIVTGDLAEQYCYLPGVHQSMYQARMINTHPGPLPLTVDTHGDGAAIKVLEAYHRGEITQSKHTVHLVAPSVDEGPVIAEHDVPILPDDTKDTLNERTQWIEKATIAYAIDKFIRDQRAYQILQ